MSAYLNLQHKLIAVASARTVGTVKSIVGLTLTVAGLGAVARIGSRCRVEGRRGTVEGEVVGAEGSDLCLLPYGSWDGFAVGDRVEHDHFGPGRIVGLVGAGANARATVDFTHHGTKQLLLQYAKLRRT